MMMHNHVSILIEDPSQVGEARRMATAVAEQANLNEVDTGKLSIIISELATNILKHAKEGELLIGNVRGTNTVDVIALDRGPGIEDLEHSMSDGVSSAGTAGQGLGAVKRLSTAFEVYTRPGIGSAVIATIGSLPANHSRFEVGVVCRPVKGEVDCGDGWAAGQTISKQQLMLVDGLGHGPDAYTAAAQAMLAFAAHAKYGPTDLLNFAHTALRPTRGAALAMADIDFEIGVVKYAGVGNIAATILEDGNSRSLVSHNGTVGAEMRKVQEFSYPWNPKSILVMNSDGLTTHWRLDRYPGLENRSSLMIAAVLYRDYKRIRDDATVLVARERRAA
jgi:anti-sigma regulatory factor (Ser/Thr protein kinase)